MRAKKVLLTVRTSSVYNEIGWRTTAFPIRVVMHSPELDGHPFVSEHLGRWLSSTLLVLFDGFTSRLAPPLIFLFSFLKWSNRVYVGS